MNWERLLEEPAFDLRRAGRYLVADLKGPHQVVSTSVRHGGWTTDVRWLVNHQSCEGAAHLDRHQVITETGLDGYHDRVCAEAGVPAGSAKADHYQRLAAWLEQHGRQLDRLGFD